MEENRMEENRMKKHVNVAAIIQIVFGALLILGALVIVFAFGFAEQFVDDPTALKVLDIVMVPLVTIFGLFGAAMVAGGIGLLTCQSWGRVLTLVMAALGLTVGETIAGFIYSGTGLVEPKPQAPLQQADFVREWRE